MSEREYGGDIRFLLVLLFMIAIVTGVLFSIKDSEIRDLQRRVAVLEGKQ
jgi:hypothetical protein